MGACRSAADDECRGQRIATKFAKRFAGGFIVRVSSTIKIGISPMTAAPSLVRTSLVFTSVPSARAVRSVMWNRLPERPADPLRSEVGADGPKVCVSGPTLVRCRGPRRDRIL